MIKYNPGTLGKKLISHNNNYGFDVSEIVNSKTERLPSLSVVIPYYNAAKTINHTLGYLNKSLQFTGQTSKNFQWEIIIIDDGSDVPISEVVYKSESENTALIELKSNRGRFFVRNLGIDEAKNDILMFVDADVLISKKLIADQLKIHHYMNGLNKNGITFSLFNFITFDGKSEIDDSSFEKVNDFRESCIYQKNWIGCKDDLKFVNNKYTLMKSTGNLKNWPEIGNVGPWFISNMVLGGQFAFDRKKAKSVGGCSELFNIYGFEETSLVTKMIASFDSYVIPVLTSNSIHLELEQPQMSRSEKDRYFRMSHHTYFNKFLKQKAE